MKTNQENGKSFQASRDEIVEKFMEMEKVEQVEKKKKRRKLFFVLFFFATLGVVSSQFFLKAKEPVHLTSEGLPKVTDAKKISPKEMKEFANQEVNKTAVTLKVFPDVNIDSDGKSGNMFIQNVPVNMFAQTAKLVDEESGKTLYESGLIEPGSELSFVQLKEKLTAGNHKAKVLLTFFDTKKKKAVGQTVVKVDIHVKQAQAN